METRKQDGQQTDQVLGLMSGGCQVPKAPSPNLSLCSITLYATLTIFQGGKLILENTTSSNSIKSVAHQGKILLV